MADAAFRYQQQLEKGEKVIVGVNKYVTDDDSPLEILRISAEVEREQKAELARRGAARDQEKVQAALDDLQAAAGTDDNLIPRLVDAARVEVTVGEMAAALKKVWGEYTEPPRF
jgi:methylmalonyl-CoA mutase, N-terminal domain